MLDGEAGEREVADMIGTEGEDEDEEGVERDHPEHVLQEHQRPVQTCNNIQGVLRSWSRPGQLLIG